MEDYTTFAYVPVEKKYRVQRNKFHGKKYEGNCDGLAQWYYTNMNYNTDNIKIYIFGDLHQTIPNPYHLSVEYEEENGNRTERYQSEWDVIRETGPQFLSKMWKEYENKSIIHVPPRKLFHPPSLSALHNHKYIEELRQSGIYGIHFCTSLWFHGKNYL